MVAQDSHCIGIDACYSLEEWFLYVMRLRDDTVVGCGICNSTKGRQRCGIRSALGGGVGGQIAGDITVKIYLVYLGSDLRFYDCCNTHLRPFPHACFKRIIRNPHKLLTAIIRLSFSVLFHVFSSSPLPPLRHPPSFSRALLRSLLPPASALLQLELNSVLTVAGYILLLNLFASSSSSSFRSASYRRLFEEPLRSKGDGKSRRNESEPSPHPRPRRRQVQAPEPAPAC